MLYNYKCFFKVKEQHKLCILQCKITGKNYSMHLDDLTDDLKYTKIFGSKEEAIIFIKKYKVYKNFPTLEIKYI